MNSSKRTKILDIVCVLLVLMTGVIRLVRENLVQIPSNTVIFLLFVTAEIYYCNGNYDCLFNDFENN